MSTHYFTVYLKRDVEVISVAQPAYQYTSNHFITKQTCDKLHNYINIISNLALNSYNCMAMAVAIPIKLEIRQLLS